MTELEELRARIQVLEDIEDIKRLRNKYFRCLNGKLWDDNQLEQRTRTGSARLWLTYLLAFC